MVLEYLPIMMSKQPSPSEISQLLMQAKQQQQPTFVEVSSGTQTISSANFMV